MTEGEQIAGLRPPCPGIGKFIRHERVHIGMKRQRKAVLRQHQAHAQLKGRARKPGKHRSPSRAHIAQIQISNNLFKARARPFVGQHERALLRRLKPHRRVFNHDSPSPIWIGIIFFLYYGRESRRAQ